MPTDEERKRKRPSTRSHTGEGGLDIDMSIYPKEIAPKRQRQKGRGDILTLRTAPHREETKTAALLEEAFVDENALQTTPIKGLWEKIPGDRPISQFGTPTPTRGRPTYVLTPGGTKLNRDRSYGFVCLFSNTAPEFEPETLEDGSPIKKYLPVLDKQKPPPSTATKSQALDITEQGFEKIQRERQHLEDKRPIGQQKAMAEKGRVSATHLAKAEGVTLSDNEKWEWLHLIAWMIKGIKGQVAENMAGGLSYSNTDMMFAEGNIQKLVRNYPDGIHLDVKADLKPGTHIAKTISYTITAKDFVLPFEFDAQMRTKPQRSYGDYIDTLINQLLKQTQEKIVNDLKQQEELDKENTALFNVDLFTPEKAPKSYRERVINEGSEPRARALFI